MCEKIINSFAMIANELMDDAKRSKNEVVIIQSRL
jgi:hypothetical protein